MHSFLYAFEILPFLKNDLSISNSVVIVMSWASSSFGDII